MQLADALGVPGERGLEGEQVVGIAHRLRLHAVGVGRDDRVHVLRGRDQHPVAQAVQRVGEVEHLVAQLRRAEGGVHVLAAASDMDEGAVRADGVGDDPLDLHHVGGPLAIGLRGLVDRVGDAPRDRSSSLARKDFLLDQHHDRSLVDLVHPVELVLGQVERACGVPLGNGRRDEGAYARGLGGALFGGLAAQGACVGAEGDVRSHRERDNRDDAFHVLSEWFRGFPARLRGNDTARLLFLPPLGRRGVVVLRLLLDALAQMAQLPRLHHRLAHGVRDHLRVQRAVLVDARVDPRGLAFGDRRPRHRVPRLAGPVQRALAYLGQRDRGGDAVAVGRGADEAEVDFAHHEGGAVTADHLVDGVADGAEELVLGVVEPGDDARVVDEAERVGFAPLNGDFLPVHCFGHGVLRVQEHRF